MTLMHFAFSDVYTEPWHELVSCAVQAQIRAARRALEPWGYRINVGG